MWSRALFGSLNWMDDLCVHADSEDVRAGPCITNHRRIVPIFEFLLSKKSSCVIYKSHKAQYDTNWPQCCIIFTARLKNRQLTPDIHWHLKRQFCVFKSKIIRHKYGLSSFNCQGHPNITVSKRWLHRPVATTAKAWYPLCFSQEHRTANSF